MVHAHDTLLKQGANRIVRLSHHSAQVPFDLRQPPHYHARMSRIRHALIALLLCIAMATQAADTFRVATYNVENYLETATATRPAKSAAARAKVREGIVALKPDVIALEEIGDTNALLELQGSLKSDGLDLPFWELVQGADTNIHVAVLSRLPITARRPQTNDFFLLDGRRLPVTRGFAEVDLRVKDRFSFTLIAVHLKSKVPVPEVDQADLRLEEAKVLRKRISALFAENPNLNLIVLGDFNDTHDSDAIKTILGRGSRALVDTRPAEPDGPRPAEPGRSARNITWTEFYAKEDLYTRMDYILLSRAMARHWDPAQTFILTRPDWGAASDHRPLVATFFAEEK
jgi:endonuclease/exonuclease/phosphatase family metal-dependent hydrolase